MEYDIEYEDDAETASELTKANTDLVSGKEKITLLNETVSATSIQINNTIGIHETTLLAYYEGGQSVNTKLSDLKPRISVKMKHR